MARRSDTADATTSEFELVLDVSGEERSPHVQRVVEAMLTRTAEYAKRCMQGISFFPRRNFDRMKFMRDAMQTLDMHELRDMIIGDLQCAGMEGWGPNAGGVGAFFEKHLGIDAKIPRAALRQIDLDSPTLPRDMLLLAEGAYQDVGFFIEEETPQGKRNVGTDELALRALQEELKQMPETVAQSGLSRAVTWVRGSIANVWEGLKKQW